MGDRINTPPTPLSNAFRHIEPGWRNYIEFVAYAANGGDEEMKKFLASYTAMPAKERNRAMPEQICDLAGVQPGDLIAAVSREYWVHRSGESVLIAAAQHPRMLQATAHWGQSLADCSRDRELFFRVTGGLPDKKGASIVINNSPQTANFNPSSNAEASGYRPMNQRVIDMSKLLEAPTETEAVPIFGGRPARVFAEDRQPED